MAAKLAFTLAERDRGPDTLYLAPLWRKKGVYVCAGAGVSVRF